VTRPTEVGGPWFGVIALTVTPETTAKPPVSVPAPPLEFVTVTSRGPACAPAAIVKVAVSCVGDTTTTLLAVTPDPLMLTMAPLAKVDPLILTGTEVDSA
jgi:hypothetical protein